MSPREEPQGLPRPAPSSETIEPQRLDRAELVALASGCGAPRVSLFWPLASEAGQPPQRRLFALVREAEAGLWRRGAGPELAAAILAPARQLVVASRPWPPHASSLGLLASEREARLFALPRPVRPRAWVSGRYRTSPLVPLVEDDPVRTTIARQRVSAALGTRRSCLDLPSVLALARADGLELLLAAHDVVVWGTFDATGRVELHAAPAPDDEDLVELAVAYALGHGVEVHVVPRGQIPGGRAVAALTRG